MHRTVWLLALLILLAPGCRTAPQVEAPDPSPAVLSSPSGEAVLSSPSGEAVLVAVPPSRRMQRLSLQEYHQHKHLLAEQEAVRRALGQVFPDWSPDQVEQAIPEILAFHHLVFHRTLRHDLEKNHAVARRVEGLLRELASRHEVPFLPVWGIVSWENSGGSSKVSWADAAGLGQMTWGAVEQAHAFAAQEAARLRAQADRLRAEGDSQAESRARELEARARTLDVAERHAQMAKDMGVKDERMVVEANLEDTILFFKYLLWAYGEREDLAISAYHNGVQNNDDILVDFLRRRGEGVRVPGADRSDFIQALSRHDVTWLDLWRDRRSRQMLNGQRTVYGELTVAANSHLALGDESDLYPWKILASLAALLEGPEYTARMAARYRDRWELVEVRGLPEPASFRDFEILAEQGHLVRWTGPIRDLGVAGKAPKGTRGETFSYYVTPEMAGYLADLTIRLRQATGHPKVALPIARLSGAWALAPPYKACPSGDNATHLRGVAVDLVPDELSPVHARALEDLVRSDFVMDRVYLRRAAGNWHLVLNPRWGDDYLAIWQTRSKSWR
ncbi:MAG: hypothetical protein ACOX9B_03490 [Candidatus Xenobium sp.]|nr:hypothetical protein [Burkholderiales bacterium]